MESGDSLRLKDKLFPYRNGMAGSLGGATAVMVTHPLDVIKTRFQADDGRRKDIRYSSTLHAAKTIWRQEGFRGMYAGLTPNLIGSTLAWGVYMYSYSQFRLLLAGGQVSRMEHLGMTENLGCAASAGVVTAICTNPIWVLKTRMQLNTSHAAQSGYTGLLRAAASVLKEEGLAGFMRGIGPGLFLVSHGAIQFSIYEDLKKRIHSQQSPFLSTAMQYFLAGACSKVAAALVTYPGQVVRTRIQQHQSGNVRYDRGFATVKQMIKFERISAFYSGFVPHLLRVVPSSIITLATYEVVSRLFGTRS